MQCRPLVPLIALVLSWLVIGGPAAAGPWPRAVGEVFLSTSFGSEEARGRRTAFAEIYAEAGWRAGLVPAARLRLDSPLGQEGRGDGAADLRLRWHPGGNGGLPWGLALGLEGGVLIDSGARRGIGVAETAGFALAAVHLGRGMATPHGDGWLRLTLSTEEPLSDKGAARREIFGQVGVRSEGGWIGLVSLSVFREADETTVKLRPGLGRSLGADRDILLEAVVERGGARTRGLSLSFWQTF